MLTILKAEYGGVWTADQFFFHRSVERRGSRDTARHKVRIFRQITNLAQKIEIIFVPFSESIKNEY